MDVNDELIFRSLTARADHDEAEIVDRWRKRSPDNERRYREIARLLDLVVLADEGAIRSAPPEIDALLGGSYRAAPVSAVQAGRGVDTRARIPGRFGRRALLALAAAAVLTLAIGAADFFLGKELVRRADSGSEFHDFVTGPNETANVVLGDGTVIRLGSNSRLRVPNNTTAREVSISGRAYFAVAKDESRPFTVRTPEGAVRVLGTRFSLEALGEDLQLVVIEGNVSLKAPREEIALEAKQMARVIRGNSLPVITVADPASVADWVGDFLAFQATPLRDVADEIGRKYEVQIELTEPSLGERTITAWFAGYTLDQVMEVVCIVANSDCEIADSKVTMRPLV